MFSEQLESTNLKTKPDSGNVFFFLHSQWAKSNCCKDTQDGVHGMQSSLTLDFVQEKVVVSEVSASNQNKSQIRAAF